MHRKISAKERAKIQSELTQHFYSFLVIQISAQIVELVENETKERLDFFEREMFAQKTLFENFAFETNWNNIAVLVTNPIENIHFLEYNLLDIAILIKHSEKPPSSPIVNIQDFFENIRSFSRASQIYKCSLLRDILQSGNFSNYTSSLISFSADECCLCADFLCSIDKDKHQIVSMCGNANCGAKVCLRCAKNYYSPEIGHVCNTRNLTCPFCTQAPTNEVQKQVFGTNAEFIVPIMNNARTVKISNDWWYAWCVRCYKLCPCEQKVGHCGTANDKPELNVFCCSDCIEQERDILNKFLNAHCMVGETDAFRQILLQETNARNELLFHFSQMKGIVKKCPNPNCNALCTKAGGCNHYTCIICRTHFCWTCKYSAQTGHEIYTHLDLVHGGIYDNE